LACDLNQSTIVDEVSTNINSRESTQISVFDLGLTEYVDTWRKMQAFTFKRNQESLDKIWVTEHYPVYTLGLNKRGVSRPLREDIPLVATDRGGKITYHGPGQIIFYLLLDLNRLKISIKQLVHYIEFIFILLLKSYGIKATTIKSAPGVYVNNQKIASLGLRVKNGCCFHGVSLNIDMDVSPFLFIDPCGYKELKVTQMRDLGVVTNLSDITFELIEILTSHQLNVHYSFGNL
jgi:lipoyl(octanoyl) transferase